MRRKHTHTHTHTSRARAHSQTLFRRTFIARHPRKRRRLSKVESYIMRCTIRKRASKIIYLSPSRDIRRRLMLQNIKKKAPIFYTRKKNIDCHTPVFPFKRHQSHFTSFDRSICLLYNIYK